MKLARDFQQFIVLLSIHSNQEGSMAIVINSFLDKASSEFDPHFGPSRLTATRLFYEGPVVQNQITLTAWQCLDNNAISRS